MARQWLTPNGLFFQESSARQWLDPSGLFVQESGSGIVIDTEPSTVARGETGIILGASAGGFEAAQGTGGVTLGGVSVTVTAWSDTSITVTVPTTLALQHSTGEVFQVTTDGALTADSSSIPFTAPSGSSYTDLVSPVTTSGSILFGYTGDAPVTGDQVVYTTPTSPSNITFTVGADGEWSLDSSPSVNQTVSVYVIQADGTIGTTGIVTYEVTSTSTSYNISDLKLAKMEGDLVLVGQINNIELVWLQSLDITVTASQINDAWNQYFDSQSVAAGNLNDRANTWLGSLGHTGSLADRWKKYWAS